jgi:hypothetical protein
MDARPVGVMMSDGTVRPFDEVLGGVNELAARINRPKSTVATWWARSRRGETKYPFPQPIVTLSVGPLFFPPDVDGYRPGDGSPVGRVKNAQPAKSE